jgi:CRISPR/Cas system-associated protein Cas10 (large subunit of type III CRISPR-Cas system)
MSDHDSEMQAAIEESERRFRLLDPLLQKIRKKYRGRDMQGHATCPVCGQKGKLTVAQVARNGHLHVFCETENCVRFME